MSKKNVQVFLTEDETAVLTQAAALTGVADMRGFLSGRARALLLAWAFHVRGERGGARGGTCSDCSGEQPAMWLVMGSRKYVCDACAARRNQENTSSLSACVRGGPDRLHMPAHEWETAWERVLAAEAQHQAQVGREATAEREKLVVALSEAAAALTDFDRGGEQTDGEPGNADLVGLLRSP